MLREKKTNTAMPAYSDCDMRHNERCHHSLHRISHKRQAGDIDRYFQQFDALVREYSIAQVRDRRDTVHLSVLRSFLLRRLVPL